jgi:hypothetical protein
MVRSRIAFEGSAMSLKCHRNLVTGFEKEQKLVEPIGFESASRMETKSFTV